MFTENMLPDKMEDFTRGFEGMIFDDILIQDELGLSFKKSCRNKENTGEQKNEQGYME